jgi:hypothetical protein
MQGYVLRAWLCMACTVHRTGPLAHARVGKTNAKRYAPVSIILVHTTYGYSEQQTLSCLFYLYFVDFQYSVVCTTLLTLRISLIIIFYIFKNLHQQVNIYYFLLY